jgi:hypothetical protein
VDSDVEVVNFQAFGGMDSDSIGCTSFSFRVNLGLWRATDALVPPREHDAEGRPRPQEYECEPHRFVLQKSLSQPWFRPFASDTSNWPASFRAHQAALKTVFPSNTHDVQDIWFVLADGSNLKECVEDARRALKTQGLSWFDEFRK